MMKNDERSSLVLGGAAFLLLLNEMQLNQKKEETFSGRLLSLLMGGADFRLRHCHLGEQMLGLLLLLLVMLVSLPLGSASVLHFIRMS